MSNDKQAPVRLMSPLGTFDWPYLTLADTKFKVEGKYKLTHIVEATHADIEAFTTAITAAAEASYTKFASALKPGKRLSKAKLPFFEQDGLVYIKASLNASGVNRDGVGFTQKPKLWDKFNKPWDAMNKPLGGGPGNGSRGRLMVEAIPFNSPTDGAGVSLRLKEVQIIEYVERSFQETSAFGAVEQEPQGFGLGSVLNATDDSGDF